MANVGVMNMVADNMGKGAAHTAHNARLTAVVNFIVPHNVPTHIFLIPAVLQIGKNNFGIGLCAAFGGIFGPAVVF